MKFHHLIYLFCFFIISNKINGQQVTFEKNYHINGRDHGVAALEIKNNNYFLLVYTQNVTNLQANLSILKIDSTGNKTFQKDLCGYYAKRMYLLKDSNLIILSSTQCFTGFNFELSKLNLALDTLWNKQFYSYASNFFYDLAITSDNGFLIACQHVPSVFKTDSNGIFLWSKNISMSWANSVKETLDGGFIVAGHSEIQTNSFVIEKYDSTGANQWSQGFGYNPNNCYPMDEFTDVVQLPDSNFIVSGFMPFCISKINYLTGDTIWTRLTSQSYWMKSLALTNSLKIAIAGERIIAEFDTSGNQLWTKYFPNVELQEIKTTSDGGFIATGDYYPNITQGPTDAVLIRLDSLGNVTNFISVNELHERINDSFVYPNPVDENSELQFNNKMNDVFVLSVADVQGRLVETVTVRVNSARISNANKHSGVYFYTLRNQRTGEMMNGKFVVE